MRELKNSGVIFIYISVFIAVLFCGCVGMAEKAGQALDGSALIILNIYRAHSNYGSDIDVEIVENKNNEKSIIITAKEFPMVKLRGTYPHEDGIFYFTSLEYLSASAHGWNEFSMELYGSGSVSLSAAGSLEIIEAPEQLQITKGRIHNYDTRITGNDALVSLRNRFDRVASLTEWMLSVSDIKGQKIDDFEKSWKPVLFPEMVSQKNRPVSWRQAADVFRTAEDVNWNISYTKRMFPEELIPVRDSGTMLRDWEEALSLIYLEYEWENFLKLFSQKLNLNKIK